MAENIHKNHRQRLKAQMKEAGLDSFADHNLLEVLLFYSLPQKDTNPIAHRLLERFGSISGVLDASFDELCDIDGIKDNSAMLIKLAAQLTKRYWSEQNSEQLHPVLDDVQKLSAYLITKFIGVNEEQVFLLCLDSNLRVITCERISVGSINQTTLDYRVVVEKVIRSKAVSIVLSHNHPNASVQPSNNDIVATNYIKSVLSTIHVELIDHIIVSGRRFSSMRQLEYI